MLGVGLVLAVAFGWLRSRRGIVALFLCDMGLWSVDRLDVFPERAGVRVALGAAGNLTHIWFLPRRISNTDLIVEVGKISVVDGEMSAHMRI